MFIEIAYGLLGLALVALVIYMIFFLSKIGKVVDETQKTIQVLTSDVNVTLHQTNDLLAKVNVLTFQSCISWWKNSESLYRIKSD